MSIKTKQKIQERTLRFLYDDHTSTYECLLENCNISTLHLRGIKVVKSEILTSFNNLNPKFMNEMFEIKDISYDLRNSNILFQPKFSKITYVKIIKYYGAHIWKLLPNDIKNSTTIDNFKLFIKNLGSITPPFCGGGVGVTHLLYWP